MAEGQRLCRRQGSPASPLGGCVTAGGQDRHSPEGRAPASARAPEPLACRPLGSISPAPAVAVLIWGCWQGNPKSELLTLCLPHLPHRPAGGLGCAVCVRRPHSTHGGGWGAADKSGSDTCFTQSLPRPQPPSLQVRKLKHLVQVMQLRTQPPRLPPGPLWSGSLATPLLFRLFHLEVLERTLWSLCLLIKSMSIKLSS